MRCPSCQMESPQEATYCDFCKEPFQRKAKPAAAPEKLPTADPLAGLTKEQLSDLPIDQLLKDEERITPLPAWLRPAAWTFLAVLVALSIVALTLAYNGYKRDRPVDPGPAQIIFPGQP